MQNKPSIEGQYHTMVVIWAALVMSQLIFVAVVFFTRPQLFRFDFGQPVLGAARESGGGTAAVVIGFAVVAVTVVVLSFAFKRRLYERAAAEQSTAHVQTGLIIALALCEASSLLGITLAFAFDYQYFFLWIALGVVGSVLHFPRRDDLHAAGYRK